MGLDVKWSNCCHIDGIHGSHGFCVEDKLNNLGLKKWFLYYPRGKDGRSASTQETTYTINGVKGSLNHSEMVAKIKELGLWKESVCPEKNQ